MGQPMPQQQQQMTQQQQQGQQQGQQIRMMQGGQQQQQMMGQQQGGMMMQQQQQQQQQMRMQMQQRMMMQQQQQQQQMGGQRMGMGQSPSMLEQRLQQQNMLRPRMQQPGMRPGMVRPPPYGLQGPQAPAHASPSPQGYQGPGASPQAMNPSPQGRPVPSPVMNAPTPSPGGGISSNVNTPMAGGPDSVADREYMDKVKQLEKYIEPLRRMITKIGTEDQDRLAKMKKLLEILSNPEKRMPLQTLAKCEDVLKKMNLPDCEPGPEGGGLPSTSYNPLLEAVLKARGVPAAQLNHALSRTFLPPLRAVVGAEIALAPLPASPPDSEDEEEVRDVVQGEIARLEPRFKVWLSPGQPSGPAGSVRLVCQLEDQDLPAVPTIEVTLPSDYPAQPPVYPGHTDHLATPFLTRVQEALNARLLRLPPRHTLTQLLTAWELSVRAACSLTTTVPTLPSGASLFSV